MANVVGTQQSGHASLIAVLLTAVAITINHLFTLGSGALFLGAVLLVLPSALWWSFRRTGKQAFRAGYLFVSAWIVVGFGLFTGFWDIVLPVYAGTLLSSLSPAYPPPVFGPFWFEMSGIVMFIGSIFVLYYGVEMIDVNRRRTALVATASAATFAAVLVGYAATDRDISIPPARGTVKIGVIVPTEGPYAMLGGSFVKAVQMAKDDLKDTKYRYELVIRDSGPDPANARNVIRQVVSVDKVDAIVGGISLIGQVTTGFATERRIPHLCVCTVSWIGDGRYNFTNIPSPEAEGVLWAQEARRRGIKTVALISQDYPSINNHIKALKIEAARAGVAVAAEQRFESPSATSGRSSPAQNAPIRTSTTSKHCNQPWTGSVSNSHTRASAMSQRSSRRPSATDRSSSRARGTPIATCATSPSSAALKRSTPTRGSRRT
jgi:Periplasmic binding protein